MKILISPSKTMNYLDLQALDTYSQSQANELTEDLLATLNNLGYDLLKDLYKASDKIVSEAIKANNEVSKFKAIGLFNGLVYKNLDYCSMNKKEKQYIDGNLLIFSALYGIIPAEDAITPYRLDLNNSLKPYIMNLTRQWKPYINKYINNMDTDLVIDLSSTEYRKLIDVNNLEKNYIRIEFKDLKNGKYKSMATFSKMARGKFVRQMAIENVTNVEEIKKITVMDYIFNEKMSSMGQFIFVR